MSKVIKRIEIEENASLVFEINEDKTRWILEISFEDEKIKSIIGSGTVISLLMAKRDFEGRSTRFFRG